MKRFLLLLSLLCLLLAGCKEKVCQTHVDADGNDICDKCNESVIVVVDVYTINDLHGKLLDGATHPGVDELTTYLQNAKEQGNVLLLSTGDMWQGSAESNLTQGAIITDWMNELDFAAMTMGNHEFDWGEAPPEANEELAEFPLLAINVYDRQTNERVEYCEASTVVEYQGVQIGIIGAIGDCYSSIAPDHTKGIYFQTGSQLTALVKAEAERLRGEGVDFIIYALHDGLGESYSNSLTPIQNQRFTGYYDPSLSDGSVDLVFEGHTHQKYLVQDGYGVCHLQNGGDNNGITHAQVYIHSISGETWVKNPELISTSEYEHLEDAPLIDELTQKYDESIGYAFETLATIPASRPGDTLRQLVADLYYLEGLVHWGSQYDITLAGGFISIRDPGYLARGEVTYADLQGLFPFDNELVLCSIKGRDLIEKFLETDNRNYFVSYGDYGEQIKDHIEPDGTYYVVVDSYTSTYAPNNLTEIERYGAPVYARDLLANYIMMGGLG